MRQSLTRDPINYRITAAGGVTCVPWYMVGRQYQAELSIYTL